MIYDLIILGAGAGGSAVAYRAALNGLSVALLDVNDSPGFASVRNQGWLQSGAIFALSTLEDAHSTVTKCMQGAQLLREFDAESELSAVSSTPGMMIFHNLAQQRLAAERIAYHGLFGEILNERQSITAEPLLGTGPPFAGAIMTTDTVFNAPKILNRLIGSACQSGCDLLVSEETLNQVKIERDASSWKVFYDGGKILSCSRILLACGSHIPSLIEKNTGNRLEMKIWRSLVLALNTPVVTRLIMMIDESTHRLNIAPFSGGITINLGQEDRIDSNEDDYHEEDVALERMILASMMDYIPGIINAGPVRGRFYACQKLDPPPNIGGGKRDFFFGELEEGFHYLYPGKFTQCLLAADSFLASAFAIKKEPRQSSPGTVSDYHQHPGSRPNGLLTLTAGAPKWSGI